MHNYLKSFDLREINVFISPIISVSNNFLILRKSVWDMINMFIGLYVK